MKGDTVMPGCLVPMAKTAEEATMKLASTKNSVPIELNKKACAKVEILMWHLHKV